MELFGYIFEDLLSKLLFAEVIANNGIFEVISTHLLHEHVEGDALARQFPRRHILKELVDFCCLICGIRALDNFEELGELDHPALIVIHCVDHLLNFLPRLCEPKSYQWVLQFLYADGTTAVRVQRSEALLEFPDLFIMEVEDVPFAVLDQPLPLLLVVQVLHFGPVLLLPLRTSHNLAISVLYYFLILI
jgi:hypothetical protein